MLSCRDVVKQADQLIDHEMSWRGRLAIRFHLLICHNCRRYIKQLRQLISAIPGLHQRASDKEVESVMAHLNNKPDHSA